ncbi:MAG: ABC transporter permease [Candidatus Hydrogenedentota bacterium]
MTTCSMAPLSGAFWRDALRDLIRARELLRDLVWKDLRVRYRYAAMGFLWAILEPLLMTLILTFVFSIVFRYRPGADALSPETPFAVFLLCGLIFWNFLRSSVSDGAKSLVANRVLVGKVNFPLEIIPYASIGVSLVNLSVGFVIFLGIYLAFGGGIGGTTVLIAPLFLIQLAIVAGLTLILSCLNVFFRDVQFITDVLLTFGFYASPIFYDAGLVRTIAEDSPRLAWIVQFYMLNPMACLITAYRDVLLNQQWPQWQHVAWPAFLGGALFVTGLAVFRRHAGHMADHL